MHKVVFGDYTNRLSVQYFTFGDNVEGIIRLTNTCNR